MTLAVMQRDLIRSLPAQPEAFPSMLRLPSSSILDFARDDFGSGNVEEIS
jgi:hypothetical protein